MKNYFLATLFSSLLVAFSCASTQKGITNQANISIEITSIKNFKEDGGNANYELAFTIKNNSKHEIYFPSPINEYEAKFLYFPEFLDLKFEHLSCDFPITTDFPKGKKLNDFKKLLPGETLSLTVNPSVFRGTFCDKKGPSPYTVQIQYAPNPKYLTEQIIEEKFTHIKDKALLKNIFEKIPRDTVYSNVFNIKQIK